MKKTEQTASDDFNADYLQLKLSNDEEICMSQDSEKYSEAYRELAELLGDTAVLKLWRRYSGLNVIFPKKLYSREYTRKFIETNMGVIKPSEMARMVDLSERRVRQIIKEIKENGGKGHDKKEID